ncbi:MAG: Enolase [Microgenomates bacterium OLB23]|nr:MAG: Enolase [Microgenomates bacterium OLB23]
MNITRISGLEVLDSRGNPTVKAYVELENGIVGSALVPSGASTGSHEAIELRDGDNRYGGLGVQKALDHINNTINPLLVHKPIENLRELDMLLLTADENPQKTTLGANTILAVSMALARTLSQVKKQPLWQTLHDHYFTSTQPAFPRLMVNVINGGAHANWNLDFQEYMLVPVEKSPAQSVRQASEIFHGLRALLIEKNHTVGVGDEGGFAPALHNNEEALVLISDAIQKVGYSRAEIDIAIDVAANELYKNGQYELQKEHDMLSAEALTKYYEDIIAKYNILSLEDPFAEDDWEAFAKFTNTHGKSMNIVGDDLFVTNVERIKKGIELMAANSVLIKPNQIGSVLETAQAILATRKAGWNIIISHRSGETEDSFIADLAVACGADFIKSGSMSRSERLAKYNRLLEIEARELSQ